MTEQEKWALQTGSILTDFFRQIRFARAAELARSRRYMEATIVLSPNGGLPVEPRELDLLARIAAQQKKFDQAILLWKAALQCSAGHETYERAIRRAVAAKRTHELRRMIVVNLIMAVVAAMLVVVLLHLLPRPSPAPKNQLKQSEAAAIHSPAPEATASQPVSTPPRQ
jgi:hypothetical protein